MESQWYEIGIPCPKCGEGMTLTNAYYGADGEWLFKFICVKCKQEVAWRAFASQFTHTAMVNDLKRAEPKERKAIQPVKPKEPELTQEDRDFLHEQGVEPPKDLDKDEKGDGDA